MLCKHIFLVLISCFFINVFAYELKFESCGNNGWTCSNNTNGKIDVTFSCPQELEKNDPTILWEFKGLLPLTQSVTIKDCNTALKIGIDTGLIATGKYPHLNSFIVKNVAELIINEATFSLPEMLKGTSEIKFENIKQINSFNKNTIGGNLLDNGADNSPRSLTFEMKDVQINNVKERAIWWTEGEISFKMIWDNVTASVIEGNAIHISDTKTNPKSQVFIRNCKFGELKRKSFNVHSTNFQFTDNEVNFVEKSAFRIQSDSTVFQGNNFNHIANYAFLFVNIGTGEKNLKFESNTIHQADKLSMNFGAPYYNDIQGKVSFHDNKFNCLNSTWLQRSDNEKIDTAKGEEEDVQYYKYLKKIEKVIVDNTKNTCTSLPCSISLLKYKDLYTKNGQSKSFCD